MQKFLLVILLLAMQGAIKGQSKFELLYWFDSETKYNSVVIEQAGEIELDVQHLDVGLHTLFLQIKDDKGTLSSPVTKSFYRVALKNQEMRFSYWFDGDDVKKQTDVIAGNTWKCNIDVDSLDTGLHRLYVQASDNEGISSSIVVKDFCKIKPESQVTTYTCWFNEDVSTAQKGTFSGDIIWLDVSALPDGFHTLYMQAEQYSASPAVAHSFIKVPQTDAVGELTCLIFIDDKLLQIERTEPKGGLLNLNIDVASLSQGVHTLQVNVVTPTGAATNVSTHVFIRSTTDTEMANLKCYYSIDGSKNDIQAGVYDNDTYHFDLDVALLDDGIHQISYMLVGDNAVSTEARTSFFIKTPVGGNGIVRYDYWLNDNDSSKVVAKLSKRIDPLKLITLLPVETVPIRSSQFHFEVKNGIPKMYAKNTLNMRFYDVSTRFTDFSREYIDYNVVQDVSDITPITRSEKSKTFKAPAENEVKWFSFNAMLGDSVLLKTNKTCSISLFNSVGDEIYSATGGNSMLYGGKLIPKDGVYYIALHDVTSTQVRDITLDYSHIEKYAVLEYSPNKIGLLGETFIDMKLLGNGYDKLINAHLRSSSNVLNPDSIKVFGRSETKLLFYFDEDVALGKYDIVLEFDDKGVKDSLVLKNAVTIEPGVWVEPEVTVTSKPSIARPYPVKIKIKNKSNIGMVYVPINIAFDHINEFDNVEFENFQISIPDTTLVGNYRPYFVTDDFLGKGISALVMNLFIPMLNPGEEKEYILGFTGPSSLNFNMYAWTGKALNHPEASLDSMTNIPSMWYYLYEYGYLDKKDLVKSRIKGSDGSKKQILNMIGRATDRAFDCADNAVSAGMFIAGIENGLRNSNYEASLRNAGFEPGDPMWGEVMGHVGPMPNPDDIQDGIRGLIRHSYNNTPSPDPTPAHIQNPADPNDIIGYSAKSGSKYVRKGLLNVGYTIQFENDPKIATAAAHKIVVKDTLDGTLFDLSTFAAKGALLGDKRLELNGEKSFVKTLDMRTRIDVIAEVALEYDELNGIATWTITSLDPMTMEETFDYMQGVLPVNYDGNGQGELYFDIKLREGLSNGVAIPNCASIVFDYEDAIITPTWTNIIDNIEPISIIKSIEEVSDTTICINWNGSDEGSGIYRYQLYVQEGRNADWTPLLGDTLRTSYTLRYSRDVDLGFCVLATDSAGNVETKELKREFEFNRKYIAGDADKNYSVDLLDINATLNYILGNECVGCDMIQMDSNQDGNIDLLDINATLDIILNSGNSSLTIRRRPSKVISIIKNRPVL